MKPSETSTATMMTINDADGISERKLMLKIDLWLLPCVVIIFLLSFLDKTNIANANIFGLSEDLNLHGNQFNTALVMLFVAYAIFDIPFTIALRQIRPSIWLPMCTFFFGIISMCQGFVTSYSGLLAARFFLGVVEAGSFSGCFYLLSHWYRRNEAQKRFTFFYSSSQLAGAFSGLLASAIGHLNTRLGYSSWQWIFIIEGACTAVIALILLAVLPDFPQQSKWLTAREKSAILTRLGEDGNGELDEAPLTFKRGLAVLKKPKVLLSGFFYFILLIPGYAQSFFVPTIIKGYTDGAIRTQLLSVPPWACAFVFSLFIAWISDRFQHRFLCVALPLLLLAVPGYAILLSVHHDSATQYAALFLVQLGVYSPLPIVVCWCSMNVRGHTDRGIALGWLIGVAQFAGIPAVYLFLKSQAPRYTTGYATCLACVLAGIIFAVAYAFVCWTENRDTLKERDKDSQQDRRPGLNVI